MICVGIFADYILRHAGKVEGCKKIGHEPAIPKWRYGTVECWNGSWENSLNWGYEESRGICF